MHSIALLPALALLLGTACGPVLPGVPHALVWLLPATVVCAAVAWCHRAFTATSACLTLGFWISGVVLAAGAAQDALHASLRAALTQEVGGFSIDELGPELEHDPIRTRAEMLEDASPRDGYVSLRVRVGAIRVGGVWRPVEGGVTLSVNGSVDDERLLTWRAGRTIEVPVRFRRPARYLNRGVRDFERDLALDGTTLLGTVKSGLLVEVVSEGSLVQELSADVRARVRAAMARWVLPYGAVSAAIASAVLIGDRTGLPDETREDLQAAGTYHVIAISGGNIALLAAAVCGLLAIVGVRGRAAAVLAVIVLVAYANVVTAGPSVWRATVMAIAYFSARACDHRTPVWQAMSLAALLVLVVHPLDLRDPGFVLTFGATVALVEGARLGATLQPRSHIASWIAASLIGTLAVEAALLPVSAFAFSRVTSAGLVLNLVAVPAMGVLQVAAMIVTAADWLWLPAEAAGWVTHMAATALVSSAHLVREAPWLALRVPPPSVGILTVYYAALAALIFSSGRRRLASAGVFALSLIVVVTGVDTTSLMRRDLPPGDLRLTMFDVGQGEAVLLEAPDRSAVLIDTGGQPFGGGLDVGERVLAPALWARGIRLLDALLVTHGDPDHLGGARAVYEDFRPRRIWEGIRVPRHVGMQELEAMAARDGTHVESLRAGQRLDLRGLQVRVLHPSEPDWERRRVRNDDSVVLEIVHGDVALLLTGDIGAEIERAIIPYLTPARTRILKVAHHGSRTSTSRELLDAWLPQMAIVSVGRGNRFGHPATDVLQRLEAVGATVLRTDRDGQITIESDGARVRVKTFGGQESNVLHAGPFRFHFFEGGL